MSARDDEPHLGGGPTATWFRGELPILARARRYSESGRHDFAADELRKGLAEHPGSAELHAHLGNELHSLKKLDAAADESAAALALDPTNILAKIVLVHVAIARGQHTEAERLLLETLHEDPSNVPLLALYAMLILRVGQKVKARRLLETILEIDPECESAHSMMAALLSEMDFKKAAAHAGEGLRMAPDSDVSHLATGVAAIRRGRPFLARKHFREALRIDPTDTQSEELFLTADKCTRPTYLPLYYISIASGSLPGGMIGLWVGLLIAAQLLRMTPATEAYYSGAMMGILVFAIYTWVAGPITSFWIRLFPPRLHD